MHPFLESGTDDLGGGQADAFVDHFKTRVSGPHRDLFRSIGVTIQPWLADQHLEAAAEALRDCAYLLPQNRQLFALTVPARCRLADTRGRPILPPDPAKRPSPFAGGHPRDRKSVV